MNGAPIIGYVSFGTDASSTTMPLGTSQRILDGSINIGKRLDRDYYSAVFVPLYYNFPDFYFLDFQFDLE
jgi:hypothetical protein